MTAPGESAAQPLQMLAEYEQATGGLVFRVNRPVVEGAPRELVRATAGSHPLAAALFELESVERVLLSPGAVTIFASAEGDLEGVAAHAEMVLRGCLGA